jgi:hypothetical protein
MADKARERDRKAQRIVREFRVQRAGLEPCGICGGATVPVDDETLACVCATERAELAARVEQIRHRHRDPDRDSSSSRIVPDA